MAPARNAAFFFHVGPIRHLVQPRHPKAFPWMVVSSYISLMSSSRGGTAANRSTGARIIISQLPLSMPA